MNLKNKNIYVIGGLGRIGQEVVAGLLEYDASVIIIDRQTPNGLNPTFKNDSNVKFIKIDSDEVEAAGLVFAETVENFGCPDVFINCSYPRTEDWASNSFEKISLKSMRKNIDIHLNSYIWLAKLAADYMKEFKKSGSIILTSSIYGLKAQDLNLYHGTSMSENLTYGIIKAGIIQGSRQMASYYGQFNIRINSICPGGVQDKNQNKKFIERYSSKTPLKRMATPSDLIGAYLFLSSDLSTYVTGEVLMVDGGFSIT
jgi:NAD(P)-dependent dehydrogenase (short-subunit alcohol dehydrogenase family)